MQITELQSTVASAISSSNSAVTQKVIDFFAEKEITRRVAALTASISELEKLEKDGLKIKADQKFFDADGKVALETFSSAKNDERKKLAEKIEKYRKAIDKALTNNDFGDLFNLSKSDEKSTEKNSLAPVQ